MDRTAFAEISEYLYNKEEPMCVTVTLAAKSQNPRLLRWSLVLQKCKFTEVHIPGKKLHGISFISGYTSLNFMYTKLIISKF